jgi:hypothetical protein
MMNSSKKAAFTGLYAMQFGSPAVSNLNKNYEDTC